MLHKVLLLLCCVTLLVTGARGISKGHEKKSRFITFDTAKDDIEVSLDFNVPFLSIPIKKTVHSMLDGLPGVAIPQINLNPSALAFGGLMVLVTSVLLPLLSKGLSTYNTDRYYRDSGSDESNFLTDFTHQFMSASGGCPLKIACWMSQKSNNLAAIKTVEQVIRNKLVSSIFNITSVEEAILNGKRGRNCEMYEPCLLREEYLLILMKNFGILPFTNLT